MKNSLPPVIANCLPKAGTNIIKRLFGHLPLYRNIGFSLSRNLAEKCGKDPHDGYMVGIADPVSIAAETFEKFIGKLSANTYVIGHLPFAEKTRALFAVKNCHMILLLRDPRAVVCSFVFYVLRKEFHYLHEYFAALPDMSSRLIAVMKGISPSSQNNYVSLRSIGEQFSCILKWLAMENSRVIFFEHLIGEKGGGTRAMQKAAVSSILDQLGYCLPSSDIDDLCSKLYSEDSVTFRSGRIGDWQNYFSTEAGQVFEQYSSGLLKHYKSLLESAGEELLGDRYGSR